MSNKLPVGIDGSAYIGDVGLEVKGNVIFVAPCLVSRLRSRRFLGEENGIVLKFIGISCVFPGSAVVGVSTDAVVFVAV